MLEFNYIEDATGVDHHFVTHAHACRIVKVDSFSFLPFPEHKSLFSNFYIYSVKQTED